MSNNFPLELWRVSNADELDSVESTTSCDDSVRFLDPREELNKNSDDDDDQVSGTANTSCSK